MYVCVRMYMYIHVLMRDEKEGRSKQGQTNNKAKKHSTPTAITYPRKNELPRVGLESTICTYTYTCIVCICTCACVFTHIIATIPRKQMGAYESVLLFPTYTSIRVCYAVA